MVPMATHLKCTVQSTTIPRTLHAMVATETHIYVICGEGQGIEPEISLERYDPAVNLWSFVLPMNCGKVGACSVELEGKSTLWEEIMAIVRFGNVKFTMLRHTSGAWLKVNLTLMRFV